MLERVAIYSMVAASTLVLVTARVTRRPATTWLGNPSGELSLQGSTMHAQQMRRGTDIAVRCAQCLLDVLPLDAAERNHGTVFLDHPVLRRIRDCAQDHIDIDGFK